MSVLEGGIYFDELIGLPSRHLALLMAGLVLALLGALLMGIAGFVAGAAGWESPGGPSWVWACSYARPGWVWQVGDHCCLPLHLHPLFNAPLCCREAGARAAVCRRGQ